MGDLQEVCMVNDCMMHTGYKHEGCEVGMTEAEST